MMFTLEHALILILALAVIYYVIQHRNLLTDLLIIPDRDHPELKAVKGKHYGRVEDNNNQTFRINIGRDACKIQTGDYDGRYTCLTDNQPVIYCGPYMSCKAPGSRSSGYCVADEDRLKKYFDRHPESVGKQSCLLRR